LWYDASTVLWGFGVQRLPGIHGLRAIAAIGVVFVHVAYVPAVIRLPPIFDQIVPHLGYCVPLFFVISAFSLAYVHDKSVGRDGWIGPYFIKRIFRIGPLFWAMMVAYWFFWLWPQRHLIELLIINATFAFNFFPGAHESIVAAGWSVGVEMPFYFAFPFIIERVRRLQDAVIFLVATGLVSVASRLWFAGNPGYAYVAFSSNIAIFAVGLLAYRFFVSWGDYRKLRSRLAFIAIAWSAAFLLFLHFPIDAGRPLLGSVCFGLLCAWQAATPSRWLANSAMQWLGERSFSIYLLHPLTINQLARHDVYSWVWQSLEPTIGAWAYLPCVALTLTIVLSLSAVTYALIERPGQKLGAAIIAALRARRPSSIAQPDSPVLQSHP
jgi:peptidoglycan/LPS O-acetylase OafA/YrhL